MPTKEMFPVAASGARIDGPVPSGFNYLDRGYTSAAIEGINNKARVITKRQPFPGREGRGQVHVFGLRHLRVDVSIGRKMDQSPPAP